MINYTLFYILYTVYRIVKPRDSVRFNSNIVSLTVILFFFSQSSLQEIAVEMEKKKSVTSANAKY